MPPPNLMSQYHARTLDLLPSRPAVSQAAVDAVGALERRIGQPLPRSVREWYSLSGAAEILQAYSNNDPAISLLELGTPRYDSRHGGTYDWISDGLLVFRYENQGVCSWAVPLQGPEDPPVLVDHEAKFPNWRHCADTFSGFVYSCVWDYTFVLGRDLLVMAQNSPLSDHSLGVLRAGWKAEVTTYGWPLQTQFRFDGGDRHLLVWTGDQGDWWLSAASEQTLADAMTSIWDLDKVGDAFWSNTEHGQAIVDRLRSTTG